MRGEHLYATHRKMLFSLYTQGQRPNTLFIGIIIIEHVKVH